MEYKTLNLKTKDKSYVAAVGPDKTEIQVLQYLPMQDKIDLIEVALQKAEEHNGSIYNEMKLEVYFNLNIIYMYTNLEFSEEDRADEMALYDELQSNDVIASVINAMDEDEYDSLLHYLNVMKNKNSCYNMSAVALIRAFIQDLPGNAEAAAKIVEQFDPEKYQEVVDFAKAANNGNPIP